MDKRNQVVCCILAIILLIVVTIIILTFALRPCKPKPVEGCTFIVTLDEDNNCYLIDGERKKELQLQKGGKYKFVINTPNHPFILTSSPKGGCLEGSIIKGTNEEFGLAEEGDFTLDLTGAIPTEFYYQSMRAESYGGKIKVV